MVTTRNSSQDTFEAVVQRLKGYPPEPVLPVCAKVASSSCTFMHLCLSRSLCRYLSAMLQC